MKRILLLCFLATATFFQACKKDTVDNVQESVPPGTTIASGSFVTNGKPTSGTVKLVTAENNTYKLVLENFQTQNGPDLRVWISPNTTANPYIQIGNLKALSGTFSYDVEKTTDFKLNNKVLIWCEDANALFGHATLQ